MYRNHALHCENWPRVKCKFGNSVWGMELIEVRMNLRNSSVHVCVHSAVIPLGMEEPCGSHFVHVVPVA